MEFRRITASAKIQLSVDYLKKVEKKVWEKLADLYLQDWNFC